MAYIGTEPKDVRSFGRAKFDYTATQGQTAFTGADDDGKTLGFTDGQMEVFVNGILMDESDFSTSNGNTVTLASAANLNDIISIVAMQTDIPNSDYVPASGGTFTGAVTASNGLTVDDDGATPLTVDRATDNGDIIDLQKDGTSVGNIAVDSNDNIMFGAKTGGGAGFYLHGSGGTDPFVLPMKENALSDNTVTLGDSARRYKDAYLGGGAYLGGTAATNKLDYYAEGSWTVNITKGGSALPVNNRYGYYTRIGDLLFIAFYWYHSGGLSSQTNNTTEYRVEGLPFTPLHLANGAYQAVPVGYLQINSTNLFNTYPHRWQCNSTTQLSLYGNNYNTTHSSGTLELGGAGVLKLNT